MEALGNPLRLRIIEMVTERERTAGELAAEFTVSRPAVSRHLRVLREADAVRWRSSGQERLYRVNPEILDELNRWVERMRGRWSGRLEALEAHLAKEARRRR